MRLGPWASIHRCKGFLEVRCVNSFRETVTAFSWALGKEKVCRAPIRAIRWLRQGCNPYPGLVAFHNVGVGWSVVVVELSAIGNLRTFPFDGNHFVNRCFWHSEVFGEYSYTQTTAGVQEILYFGHFFIQTTRWRASTTAPCLQRCPVRSWIHWTP